MNSDRLLICKRFDGIILPGGESTVQGKLLHDLNMFEPLKEKIQSGMPVLATCAGMILLASDIAEQDETYFESIPMTVKRNAYGRQLEASIQMLKQPVSVKFL